MATEPLYDRLCAALRSCGEEPWSLADVEQYDDQVQHFDLSKASTREFLERLEDNWNSDVNAAPDKIVWEIQRLAAISKKLQNQRDEREARLQGLETAYDERLKNMREQLSTQEEKVRRFEASLGHCERALLLTEAAAEKARLTPAIASTSAAPSPAATAEATADAPQFRSIHHVAAPPAQIPNGRDRPTAPAAPVALPWPNATALPAHLTAGPSLPQARPPPPPIPKLGSGAPPVVDTPPVSMVPEDSDLGSDDDNPWAGLG